MKKNLPLFLLLCLGLLWGTGYSIARYAVTSGVSPLGYSFWQSVGPALLIGLFAKFKSQHMIHSVQHYRYYLICGLTGIAIPNTNMYFAASHLPAGLLAVIVNTVPIIAYVMARSANLEKFNAKRLCSVLLALCGLMCLLLPRTSLPSATMIPWVLMALITPLSFAFCSVYITRYRPANADSLTLAAGTLIFSSLILAPFIIATHNFYLFNWPLRQPDWVIGLEILLSSLGYVVFFKLLRIAGPVYYSFVDTIVALTGLAWGYFIFGEKLNFWTGLAVIFIIFSLILISKSAQTQSEANALRK